ncbi:uncharacterized protein LOC128990823 [Macrosteles quadrilineatus]|uniref:uncharacterized protein LOC128990744 n=1 Tax=Macrosteles quadrilineatus TaxID=74068 RepID=UPI0023E17A42|nr:uncharacterized protein LOC128990744 [Macrosteles quadrilineatus]XP_054269403.1 uncharacterized protein LOC128990823 [Macrosteles quadrilineatus]
MMCKIAAFAVLALCFSQGSALKCHSCTSVTDPKCGDPIDSSLPLTECTPDVLKEAGNLLKGAADAVSGLFGKVGIDTNFQVPDANAAFACAKAVKQDGDKRVVVRSCSIPKNEKFDMCTQMKATGSLVTFCETCDSDGCNGASGLASSSLLMALLVALVAYLTKQ